MGGYDYTFGYGDKKVAIWDTEMFRMNENEGKGRYSGKSRMGWALDPMYSEADDGENKTGDQRFGVDEIHHRDGWKPYITGEPEMSGQRGYKLLNLQKIGVIPESVKDVTKSPDYIAGNFTDVDAYYDAIGIVVDDPGDSGEHEETFEDVLAAAGLGTETGGGDAFKPTDPTLRENKIKRLKELKVWKWREHIEKLDKKKREHDAKYGPDKPDPPKVEPPKVDPPKPEPVVPVVPDSPKVKTVPDEHPGATHIHDFPAEPYVPEHHDIVHHAPDATAPLHIPISVGLKVI